MNKKTKVLLAIPALLLIAMISLAFKQATKEVPAIRTYQWYILEANGDPEEPTDYISAPEFDEEENGCDGGTNVCAIEALQGTNPAYPDISGNPEQDPNVQTVLKRSTP
ncbi:MAG TPA: hypothetical protein VLC98_10705 [Phnomibacter sp.]|nr:hypothetical protein [Phnomibacter sp.]